MRSFAEFLEQAARDGEMVNVIFEERLFNLIRVMDRFTSALEAERIPYALVGGLAVLVHVEAVSPEHSALTRGVDLLIRKKDLNRVGELPSKVHLFAIDDVDIDFEWKRILDVDVRVTPVADLVRMKLTSFRLKDQVHVKTLDTVGLVTPEVEDSLPPELLARLKYVRVTE